MSFILLGILNSQAAGAGAAGGMDLLETTVLTSSASSVSFTGLGSYTDYKHLQIRAVMKSDSTSDNTTISFNSDTASNYAIHTIYGTGSNVNATGEGSRTFVLINSVAQSGTANSFSGLVFDLLDFSNTSKNSTARYIYGKADAQDEIRFGSGLWNNTDAVTSIDLASNSNYVAGTRFSLYGIR